jgi:POT family proton-dependent oligopeptide transporter
MRSISGTNIRVPDRGTLLGHPKGLYFLFLTELWERFSFYSLRAILVLYLVDSLSRGGLSYNEPQALRLLGLYSGAVYSSCVLGGLITDFYLGQRRAIILGGLLMAFGQFCLGAPVSVMDARLGLYLGLFSMVIGNGLFKPNISTMVGDLYPDGDPRRDTSYTVFYMGVIAGAMLAGVVSGAAARYWSWKAAFIAAGCGMLLSVILQYGLGDYFLGTLGTMPAARLAKNAEAAPALLKRSDKARLLVIVIMGCFQVIFWTGYEQSAGLLNLFIKSSVDRMVGGFEVPTAWFTSINPLFVVVLSPVFAVLWTRLGAREPAAAGKFALSLLFLAGAFLVLLAALHGQAGMPSAKLSILWIVAAYFLMTVGELCTSPIGLSIVSRLSPPRLASFLMGVWLCFYAAGNFLAGWIGSLAPRFGGPAGVFTFFIAVSLLAAGALLLLSESLERASS